MSKKRIVFITPGITTGGAEKQLALLAKGLLRDDFSPLIVVLSKSESGQRLSDFDGLHVVEINCRKLLNLASALRQVRVTVTGTVGAPPPAGAQGLQAHYDDHAVWVVQV